MWYIYFILGFLPDKVKKRARRFVRNKYTFLNMGGTVAPRYPIPTFYDRIATDRWRFIDCEYI